MLSPLAEASGPGPMLDLLLHARAGFPDVVAHLREATGVDAAYADAGTLVVATTAADEDVLAARWTWQSAAGLPVERLDAGEARAAEPALSPEVRMALRFPGDHQVDNRSLSAALWAAAARAGAEFRIGAEVTGVVVEGGRAAGVVCEGGERIDADAVVVAGGCWSGRLAGLPRPLPVEPVHGQLLALEAVPPVFRHVVDSPRCYLVPRAEGRVIVGATVERTGFRKAVTAAGVMRLLRGALEVAPVLADAPLLETWSGLRPGTPDGLPILGSDPDVANLLYATGHYRNGILLAPLTGRLIADLLLGREPTLDLQPFGIGRF
jgi:glycine oxidase